MAKHPIDVVVHFAAKADVGESQRDPFGFLQNNVNKSLALFECMEKHAIRKLVFSSSCAVYGEPRYLPLDEKHEQHPANVYGVSKMAIEHILRSFTGSLGWSSISLRYFNAAGASEDGQCGESHDPEHHLIPNLLKTALGKLEMATIHGNDYQTKDGTCVRDYVHVIDLARAHSQALQLLRNTKMPSDFAINLGSTQGSSVAEVVDTCENVTQRQIPRKYAPRRSGDPPALVANADLAEKLLSWKPSYDLKKIVETAWRWEQERLY
jgi:UDP-glucose 4-epimerase